MRSFCSCGNALPKKMLSIFSTSGTRMRTRSLPCGVSVTRLTRGSMSCSIRVTYPAAVSFLRDCDTVILSSFVHSMIRACVVSYLWDWNHMVVAIMTN